ILITCPTAMPKEEQIILRQCAEEAYIALLRCKDPNLYYQPYDPAEWEGKIQIIPSVKHLSVNPNNPAAQRVKTEWGYDEATCCQLVYLYAEVAKRYLNHCEDFFNLYGHKRPELIQSGYDRNALTIGSIDIGAGTTDVMVCSYKYDEGGVCKLTPQPLYWDSFYYAGDDILEEIVRAVIIEGQHKNAGALYEGPIFNAVCSAYMNLNDDEFLDALNLLGKVNFNNLTEQEKNLLKFTYASRETSERIHNFFGQDKALMDYKDRLMRQDFNIQISVPMALKMLDMLRLGRKSTRLSYEDFFSDLQPAQFILDHFSNHFSIRKNGKTYVDFDFKKITWNFSEEELSKIIITKIEPLMKQLAVVLNIYNCDIILLAGKPTSLSAITDLFLKYYPISPNRLIRLNDYRVGEWYPFADGLGYFNDQKSLVAVGAMIGYLASNGGIDGFHMDMAKFKKAMVSTANYMGLYNSVNHKISEAILSPEQNSATFEVHGFPLFIGCKQLVSQFYQARPIYSLTLADEIDLHTVSLPLKVSIVRNFGQDKESLKIVSAV
ncbi:MAG: virulence factor SrfB, partial [Muribaculaceae bacterium]|nr:virulence factor SrfB [Muribaculaceae bacterium]